MSPDPPWPPTPVFLIPGRENQRPAWKSDSPPTRPMAESGNLPRPNSRSLLFPPVLSRMPSGSAAEPPLSTVPCRPPASSHWLINKPESGQSSWPGFLLGGRSYLITAPSIWMGVVLEGLHNTFLPSALYPTLMVCPSLELSQGSPGWYSLVGESNYSRGKPSPSWWLYCSISSSSSRNG